MLLAGRVIFGKGRSPSVSSGRKFSWMVSRLMGGRNLERLTVCLKRKRVLMGLAHSIWILTTSQNVTQGGEELGKRICGVNRKEERESDQNRTNSAPGVTAGVTAPVNYGTRPTTGLAPGDGES